MAEPVFIAASPNSEPDDVALAWKLLRSPGKAAARENILALETKLSDYFAAPVVAFDSARSSFYALLKVLDISDGAEVLLPAFSCMVVANAAIWAGAKPVYIDCDRDSFGFDLKDLKEKMNPRVKAVLVQHSFGVPEDVEAIRKIVGEKVMIIEDLAHSLGGSLKGKKLGTLGDAAIMTFGIEKVISGVRGGAALVKNKTAAARLKQLQESLPPFPAWRSRVALLNPIFWSYILPVYYWGFGKYTLGRFFVFLGHKLNLFGNMIEDSEYDVIKPDWLPAQPSPALAMLVLNQFPKLDRFNAHRRKIAAIYEQELELKYPKLEGAETVFLRFPVLVRDKKAVLKLARKSKVILGDWYRSILFSPERSLSKLGYSKGSCPNAEYCSAQVINLPTHISVDYDTAREIARLVKPYLL